MTVRNILKGKASGDVVCIGPDASITDAAKLLAEKRIGSVVVSADGHSADGILSERDIVRELAAHGPSCMTEKVSTYMTPDPQTCALSDTVDHVMTRMTQGRFRHMPVVEDGRMVGLITLGDAVKSRLDELAMEKDALEGMIMGH